MLFTRYLSANGENLTKWKRIGDRGILSGRTRWHQHVSVLCTAPSLRSLFHVACTKEEPKTTLTGVVVWRVSCRGVFRRRSSRSVTYCVAQDSNAAKSVENPDRCLLPEQI